MASGSVAMVDSVPMTTAVRMLFSAWNSTSLPVRSVPKGWYAGQTATSQPMNTATSVAVTSIARHGTSDSSDGPRSIVASDARQPWRTSTRRPRSHAAAMASSRAATSPPATPFTDRASRSGTQSRAGSARCAPPKASRGATRTSRPSTTAFSFWNDCQASGTE